MSRGTPVRVNRALTRPRLVFGMEKKPLAIIVFINFFLAIGTFKTWFMLLPILFAVVGISYLIRMNKKDPQIFNIYLKLNHFKQSYYPAKSGCLNRDCRVRPSITLLQD